MLVPILQQQQQIAAAAPSAKSGVSRLKSSRDGGGWLSKLAEQQASILAQTKKTLRAKQMAEDEELVMIVGAAITNRRLH